MARSLLLALRPRGWECPSCDCTHTTTETRAHRPFHPCPGLRGLNVPMVPAGTRAEHRPHEREDYIGSDLVQTDGDGRPVMSVETIRDDGQDCTIFAPTVTAKAGI